MGNLLLNCNPCTEPSTPSPVDYPQNEEEIKTCASARKIRLMLIGQSGVGKTYLINQLVYSSYPPIQMATLCMNVN